MDPPQAVDERGHLGREGNGRNDGPEPYPNAFDYYHNLITLPLHTRLVDDDVDFIIANLTEVVLEYM